MRRTTIITLAAIVLVGGAIAYRFLWWAPPPTEPFSAAQPEAGAAIEPTNAQIVDGTQVIEILAKGSYQPRLTIAKAGIPTVLALKTSNTLDCTLAVTIPSLRYRKVLPSTGVTEVSVPPQAAGTVLQGVCSMGMYGFTVRFV